MGLINLQTNLKSLKFGHDRVYGGSSKQPYIQTPIPEQLGGFGALDTDFLLRGGSRTITDSATDVERLGKYFTDVRTPSGLLFVAKQNLLSRTAVRTQASTGILNEGAYTPLSTLIEAGGVAFGLHVNKQGLNPFDGPGSLTTYSDVVKVGNLISSDSISEALSTNRLVQLVNATLNNKSITLPSGEILNSGVPLTDYFVNVLTYSGGPNSILGTGNTDIRFADQRTNTYDFLEGNSMGTNVFDSKQILETSNEIQNGRSKQIGFFPITQEDFRKKLRNNIPGDSSTVISNSPNYTNKNIEQRVNLGNPGGNGRNLYNYTSGSFYGAASNDSYDKITALALYESDGIIKDNVINDLVKFRIEVINNNPEGKNTFIHFRAFLDNISDSYDADWKDTQYIGRGEKFYTYGGFNRKISLGWTVAAQSKIELIPMYKKLNYLASTLAPDYNPVGEFMRGNLVKLTIGGYLYEQPGIITSLSYEMKEDSTWEIGLNDVGGNDSSVKELPHVIRVSGFNFIPIHTFAPSIQMNTYGNINDNIANPYVDKTDYGPQRYISLKAIDSNYDKNPASLA